MTRNSAYACNSYSLGYNQNELLRLGLKKNLHFQQNGGNSVSSNPVLESRFFLQKLGKWVFTKRLKSKWWVE